MAAQLADRFSVPHRFTDVRAMLDESKPDVVHITTPPTSHYALSMQCLTAGANIYVEKPFTLTTDEAREVIALAAEKDLRVVPGHNGQFTHAMVRMRELVASGYLGGKPMHMESLYCYDLSNPVYAQAMLGNRDHWVRKLPGSLLQNLISHGVARVAEFLESDEPEVTAVGFTSNLLDGLGHGDIIDEVRVIIKDGDRSTAVFTFSTQIKPELHQFRLYGRKNSLVVDDDYQVLVKIDDRKYRSYLRYLVAPVHFAAQYAKNAGWNTRHFLRRQFFFPYDSGMKTLLEDFYSSIERGTPAPISPGEILRTSIIMDRIFEQVRPAAIS
ncbi:putative oxidoreductase YhhX [Microbacterium lemovicicum]|uniref:Putative oxidoreductase YhhX n=2 Tax=Microbacterium lemovicicum TaxID=1072463 RepID=A0A3S9W678_9MICO|nr:putative oxidoreductase YhhX [Microbacterium lemovicicum]